VSHMTPVSLAKIGREWADKLLSGRLPLCSDAVTAPEILDGYVQRQVATIEEQAVLAAKAWARRSDLTDDQVTQQRVAEIAAVIADTIATASRLQASRDTEVADRLSID
jgi:hypothetical protein